MDIDTYRALKSEEDKGDTGAQIEQASTAVIDEGIQEAPQGEPAQPTEVPEATDGQPEIPSVIKYGEEEYKVEELVQARKQLETFSQEQVRINKELQDARVAREYYDAMMKNPNYAKVFAENNGLQYVDPLEQERMQMERKYNDLLLEREIENMKLKHEDFNPQEVIQLAVDRSISNLEDAYLLHKARNGGGSNKVENVDIESLKSQILQEVKNELQSNVNTGSIIGSSGGGAKPVETSAPVLSSQEMKVARGLGLSPQDYAVYKQNR